MKKLILVLCLISGYAQADEWLEMANEAGGKILFLTEKCTESKDSGRMVIATTPNGVNVEGCWFYFADMVHVVWKGGGQRTSTFDPKYLVPKKSK